MDSYAHALTTGDLNTLDAICDPQVVRYDRMAMASKGLDSLKRVIALTREMYPDFKVTIDEGLYVGDHAVVRWTITGTNTGPGIFAPTGKSFKVSGLSLSRFVDGKLVEERAAYDRLDMLQQLGFQVTPPAK